MVNEAFVANVTENYLFGTKWRAGGLPLRAGGSLLRSGVPPGRHGVQLGDIDAWARVAVGVYSGDILPRRVAYSGACCVTLPSSC